MLFAPAVNVSAPLTECTETEITVGQHAVRTQREQPSDLDSSHTSSTVAHQLKADHCILLSVTQALWSPMIRK